MSVDTLESGSWGRDGTTVHAFKTYGEVVGFDGGTETKRHRAELTSGTPPVAHGHPRIS